MSTCRSCGARIEWVQTSKGKAMPLDPTPTPDGTVVVRAGVGHVIGQLSSIQVCADERRYAPHWATCPQASEWRGRGR